MAMPTLLMGLLPTYAQIRLFAPILLLILRIIQGAAIGGEVPGGWIFVAEHVPRKHIGLACSLLSVGLTFGILIGSQVALWVAQNMTPDNALSYGWRMAFILGGLLGLCAVFLRRYLQETPVFERLKSQKQQAIALPIKTVLTQYSRQVFVSMALTWVLTAGVVVILMTPSFFAKIIWHYFRGCAARQQFGHFVCRHWVHFFWLANRSHRRRQNHCFWVFGVNVEH